MNDNEIDLNAVSKTLLENNFLVVNTIIQKEMYLKGCPLLNNRVFTFNEIFQELPKTAKSIMSKGVDRSGVVFNNLEQIFSYVYSQHLVNQW